MVDVADEPNMPDLTPSLITDVVDGLSLRAASVKPTTYGPALDPYKEVGVRSNKWQLTVAAFCQPHTTTADGNFTPSLLPASQRIRHRQHFCRTRLPCRNAKD